MIKIVKMTEIKTIKKSPNSTVKADGTIVNPMKITVINLKFDNNKTIQIERPISMQKIKTELAKQSPILTFDGITEGDDII